MLIQHGADWNLHWGIWRSRQIEALQSIYPDEFFVIDRAEDLMRAFTVRLNASYLFLPRARQSAGAVFPQPALARLNYRSVGIS